MSLTYLFEVLRSCHDTVTSQGMECSRANIHLYMLSLNLIFISEETFYFMPILDLDTSRGEWYTNKPSINYPVPSSFKIEKCNGIT